MEQVSISTEVELVKLMLMLSHGTSSVSTEVELVKLMLMLSHGTS